jgi:hypothetical protein
MPNISIEEIKTLKKHLKRGDMNALSKELGISRIAIFYALSGKTQKCEYILNAVKILADRRINEQNVLRQKLHTLQ